MTGHTSDTQYWVAFNRIPGIGRARYQLLEKRFGRLENAWTASAADLRAAAQSQMAEAPGLQHGQLHHYGGREQVRRQAREQVHVGAAVTLTAGAWYARRRQAS